MLSLGPTMQDERISTLVQAFDRSKTLEVAAAWTLAESMGDDLLMLLSEALPRIRKSPGRASIMRYAGKFSRMSDVAFRMGVTATLDRSYVVRHYACALLSSLLAHPDRRTVEDARAAIDAIKSKNHNFFRDRDHSGKVNWDYA
jgi:hypothetical protein